MHLPHFHPETKIILVNYLVRLLSDKYGFYNLENLITATGVFHRQHLKVEEIRELAKNDSASSLAEAKLQKEKAIYQRIVDSPTVSLQYGDSGRSGLCVCFVGDENVRPQKEIITAGNIRFFRDVSLSREDTAERVTAYLNPVLNLQRK